MVTKQFWLDVAEIVDAWRVFPRGYMIMFAFFLWDLHTWYTALPDAKYADLYAGLVYGSLTALTAWYMGSGRKWG